MVNLLVPMVSIDNIFFLYLSFHFKRIRKFGDLNLSKSSGSAAATVHGNSVGLD